MKLAKLLNKLFSKTAKLYQQGRYAEAVKVAEEALTVAEKSLGSEHPDVALALNDLAALCHAQGSYAQAEPLYERSLIIRENALDPEHPSVAQSLSNLAALYRDQGRYAQAEPLYNRALSIAEKSLGPEHPHAATVRENMAILNRTIGKEDSATTQELKHGELKMDFPYVEGFALSEPYYYPNPNSGFHVTYTAHSAKKMLRVRVFVYNQGLDHIPDGASSQLVKEEDNISEIALATSKRRGLYISYTERARGAKRIGDLNMAPKAQYRLYEIDRIDIGRILREVYITGYRNHFIKIHASYSLEEQDEAKKAIGLVLTALGDMVGP
jgi:tetratricopeptide (TPR) repeat protein